MAQNSIDVKINLASQEAASQLKAIKAGLEDVETAEEGVQSAGKQVADAISAAADAIEADLLSTRAAADALGQALGPELTAKLGQGGVEALVSDLKKLGLTTDQIEADVDSLAGSIKHLDDVGSSLNGPTKGLNDVGDAADKAHGNIGGMRGEADQSKSVLANMVGNSAQDISNLGGVAGTAGLAIGQLGEYATEGNISLSGLAKVAGPMAALTVVTMAVAQGAKQAAERTKELEKAWKDLGKVSDQQVLKTLGDMFMRAALDGKNLNDQFKDMADNNIIGARRMLDLLEAQGMSEKQTKGLSDAIKAYDEEQVRGAENSKKYADATTEVGDAAEATGEQLLQQSRNADLTREATERAADWEKRHADALENTKKASEHLSDALDRQRQKQQDVTSAEREAVDKKYAYRKSIQDANTDIADLTKVMDDHKSTEEDVAAATDTARDSIINQSAQYATLKGAALDSKEGIDRQIDSLTLTAATLAPGSALRVSIEEYIKDLQNIPTNITTTLTTKQMSIIDSGKYIPGYKGPQAEGGLFMPTPGGTAITVAEAGQPEIVAPWDQFMEMINKSSGGGSGQTTIINHWPPGLSPSAVDKAQRDFKRRGGR